MNHEEAQEMLYNMVDLDGEVDMSEQMAHLDWGKATELMFHLINEGKKAQKRELRPKDIPFVNLDDAEML